MGRAAVMIALAGLLAAGGCEQERGVEKGTGPEPAATTGPSEGPGDEGLIGGSLPEWTLTDWVGSEPLSLADLRGRVVVVRFWTTPDCPYCRRSMPALQTLSEELADREVTIIGAYHAKPRGRASDMTEARRLAREWGVTFPIAFDRDWKTLRAWWLETGDRRATSATFVIDRGGRVAHVHPGPVFRAGDDRDDPEVRDYLELRAAVLRELPAPER